ncbi:Hypothetical predicted protein [Xyrichtys novacula]|uniref:Uncharacterized protein n=1 Tax=Xyrichtys novacula TaxID=13765 RepID=A0AAV1GDY3_XYRNO|nr:Hypothetical predicted protein [Xyrichtys novacula]
MSSGSILGDFPRTRCDHRESRDKQVSQLHLLPHLPSPSEVKLHYSQESLLPVCAETCLLSTTVSSLEALATPSCPHCQLAFQPPVPAPQPATPVPVPVPCPQLASTLSPVSAPGSPSALRLAPTPGSTSAPRPLSTAGPTSVAWMMPAPVLGGSLSDLSPCVWPPSGPPEVFALCCQPLGCPRNCDSQL